MISAYTKERIGFIEKRFDTKVSKFMAEVLDILGIVFHGLHHTDIDRQWRKSKDYCQTRYASYRHEYSGQLATFDFDELTKLVVLAHDKGIRIDINGDKHQKLRIGFHNRMGRRDAKLGLSRHHPTMSQAIKRVRENYPSK